MLDKYLGTNNNKKENKAHKYVSKILLCIIILFASLILCEVSPKVKAFYQKYVFEDTFNFMEFKKYYEKFAGLNKKEDDKTAADAQMVMKSFIEYSSKEKVQDGEKYMVTKGDALAAIESGIVVFIGEKEGYGQTLIIQGSNGFDFWYCNLSEINVGIYDFVKKNVLIGVMDESLTLLIYKNNKYYTYEEYLNEI